MIMCLKFPVIMNLFFYIDYGNVYEQVWSKQIIYITQQCGLLGQHIYKAFKSCFRELTDYYNVYHCSGLSGSLV